MPSKQRGVFVTFGMAFMVVGWVLAGLVANPICNTPTPIIPGLCNEVTYALADGGTATMYAMSLIQISMSMGIISLVSCAICLFAFRRLYMKDYARRNDHQ